MSIMEFLFGMHGCNQMIAWLIPAITGATSLIGMLAKGGGKTPAYEGIDWSQFPMPEYAQGGEINLSDFDLALQNSLMEGLSIDLGISPDDIKNMINAQVSTAKENTMRQMMPEIEKMGAYGSPAGADIMGRSMADIESQRLSLMPQWMLKAAETEAALKGSAQNRAMAWSGDVEGRRRTAFEPKMALWKEQIGEAMAKAGYSYQTELAKSQAPKWWEYGLGLTGAMLPAMGAATTPTTPTTPTIPNYGPLETSKPYYTAPLGQTKLDLFKPSQYSTIPWWGH